MADADAEEAAELVADDRAHDERFGQPQGQRGERRSHLEVDADEAVDPFTIGSDREVDVVVEHVVLGAGAFIVEAAALGQPLRGGV